MVSMNTKYWQANIEVRIFIIHMAKSVERENACYKLNELIFQTSVNDQWKEHIDWDM